MRVTRRIKERRRYKEVVNNVDKIKTMRKIWSEDVFQDNFNKTLKRVR
jgi:hypothetical protein